MTTTMEDSWTLTAFEPANSSQEQTERSLALATWQLNSKVVGPTSDA